MRSKEGETSGLETHKEVAKPNASEQSGSDAVGYGRPPKATRFAPGKSGNPRGRPKGARTVGAVLKEVVRQKITVTENGKTRRVPALEGMLCRLRNDALRGDGSALKLLFSLVDRYGDSPEAAIKLSDVLAEDQEILARYLQQREGRYLASSDDFGPPANSNPEQRSADDYGPV